MEIIENTIHFNSTSDNYHVELCGNKSNTVRFVDRVEHGLIQGSSLSHIVIHNIDTNMKFKRLLKDCRQYKGHGVEKNMVCWIFTW